MQQLEMSSGIDLEDSPAATVRGNRAVGIASKQGCSIEQARTYLEQGLFRLCPIRAAEGVECREVTGCICLEDCAAAAPAECRARGIPSILSYSVEVAVTTLNDCLWAIAVWPARKWIQRIYISRRIRLEHDPGAVVSPVECDTIKV